MNHTICIHMYIYYFTSYINIVYKMKYYFDSKITPLREKIKNIRLTK